MSALTGAPLISKLPTPALDPQAKPLYAPVIDKWYKKGGPIKALDNGKWKYTDWEHNSAVYGGDEPNFDDYARQQVDIDNMQGNYTTDFDKADEKAPKGSMLPNNTWHHKQNLKTMQGVDYTIHQRFTHYGLWRPSVLKRQRPAQNLSTKRKRP